MADLVSVLGAGAAIIAAVLAGLTLLVTGRREERKWVRAELVDTFVQFLDSSFNNEARAALEAREAGLPAEELEHIRVICGDAHSQQMTTLTRLRLLASESVIQLGETLHTADHEVTEYAFNAPLETSREQWSALRAAQRSARESFIEEARGSVGLSGGSPITHWRGRDISHLVGS